MPTQSAPNLQAALSRLDANEQDRPAARQRRFPRFKVRGEAALMPWEGGENATAPPTVFLRDVSRGGIGVLSVVSARPGQCWHIRLGSPCMPIDAIPAFCRHSHRVIDGVYHVGLEFGVEASVLLALGVHPADLAHQGNRSEELILAAGEFLAPEELLSGNGA
jgi:hypothetical protein